MELQLENLKYQDTAIQAVIKVFDGTEKNTFDNACIEGIRSNFCKLTALQLADNIKAIAKENGIDEETAKYSADNDLCQKSAPTSRNRRNIIASGTSRRN